LAVAHKVGQHFQLEFPPGKVLYLNDGYISDLRFSMAGDQIAFIDHPISADDRGFINLIDLRGNRKVLSQEFGSVQGLAWAPGGNEIWFTGSIGSEPNVLRAVSLGGKERVVLTAPGRLHLHDISKDGTVLLTAEEFRDQTLLTDSPSAQPRDIGAFPFEIVNGISRDGQIMLLNAFVNAASSDYNLYTQRTEGSAPALIGLGAGLALSWDGKWAAALDPVHQREIRIIPTGIGESRTIEAPQEHRYRGATWMPDGKHLLVIAADKGHAPSAYIQDLSTGAVRRVTSEGKYTVTYDGTSVSVSPDGKNCIITDGENHYWIQPLEGGEGLELRGLSEGDYPLEWHDSQNLFLRRGAAGAADTYELNIATGQTKLWTHFSPPDKTALLGLRHPVITPDGAHAVYVAQRIFSTLYVTKGIQ
jgi:eukaryotic-like serine/threonine-protein kinase